MWGRWGHTWPGGRILRKSGVGAAVGCGREGEEKSHFSLFFFRIPQKCRAPIFLLHPQKGKALFQTADSKKLPRLKQNNLG